MRFVRNLVLFPAVKEFCKFVENWQSYRHQFGVLLFGDTVYICRLYKMFSCRRETARCFVSLNISLSHSRLLKVIENGIIRKLGHDSNCGSICIISGIKRDMGQKRDFFTPPCIWRPHYGVFVGILLYRLVRKTRMTWLPDGEKRLMICLAVWYNTGVWRTDRRTDGRTDILRQHSLR